MDRIENSHGRSPLTRRCHPRPSAEVPPLKSWRRFLIFAYPSIDTLIVSCSNSRSAAGTSSNAFPATSRMAPWYLRTAKALISFSVFGSGMNEKVRPFRRREAGQAVLTASRIFSPSLRKPCVPEHWKGKRNQRLRLADRQFPYSGMVPLAEVFILFGRDRSDIGMMA